MLVAADILLDRLGMTIIAKMPIKNVDPCMISVMQFIGLHVALVMHVADGRLLQTIVVLGFVLNIAMRC